MPVLNNRLEGDRPIVQVYVSVSSTEAEGRRDEGMDVRPSIPAKAMIDTGAGRSHVTRWIIDSLETSPTGDIALYTVSTGNVPAQARTYKVDLSFAGAPPGTFARDIEVIGSDDLAGLGVDMLLGRDILKGCLLSFDGPNGHFSLAFDRLDG